MLLVLISAAFIYVLSTEVAGRWEETFGLYDQVREKKKEMLNPDELKAKKSSLIDQNERLSSVLTKGVRTYNQNENGVFEYLNSNAKSNSVVFESLIPKESVNSAQSREFAFKVDFQASYHQLGRFVNAIETGSVPVNIVKMEIVTDPSKPSKLHVSSEGKAYLIAASVHER